MVFRLLELCFGQVNNTVLSPEAVWTNRFVLGIFSNALQPESYICNFRELHVQFVIFEILPYHASYSICP
jgi:hypothetical protein